MRTYAAFSLLALASSTAMAAPASPDLSRDVGFSSMPNSPDLSGGSDMAAFPPVQAPDTEDSANDPLGSSLSVTKTADLAQKPALLGRASLAYREYEKWIDHKRRSKMETSTLAVRQAGASSDEAEDAGEPSEDSAAPVEGQKTQPIAPPEVPAAPQQENLPSTGDKMPDIPGVERIIMVDGVSGNDGVKVDALENATQGMPSLTNAGPSRMRHRRRDLRSALEQLHVDEKHSGDAEMPSKAKQLSTLSRKVRRAPKPVDDVVLHSNGIIPKLPKSLQEA